MRKNIFLLIALIIFAASCRKDDSVSSTSSSGAECLITKGTSANGDVTTMKYEGDIPIESIKTGKDQVSDYLQIENPKQFLYYKGGKTPDKVASRIYMTDFGSVQKEVAVSMSSDGKTITEDKDEVDIYHYDSKKLLVKIEKSYGEDKGLIELTYDSKNRVNRIIIKDKSSEMIFFEYTDFKYLDRKKNDNFVNIAFINSFSVNFIPCLRNVYITSYTMKAMPGMMDITTVYKNEFKFNGNTLSRVTATVEVLGQAQSFSIDYEVSCK